MMERLVNIDYFKLAEKTKRIMRLLKDAEDVRITNPAGTDISFSVKKRGWHIDIGDISKRGRHGNLPAGECYTCPGRGDVYGQGGHQPDRRQARPRGDHFERGKLVSSSGRGIEAVLKNIGEDPTGRIIGEFGVGTNTGARICPNMLEAEKAFGTVHFAVGDSYGIGVNKSRHHYDALIEKASIYAKGRWIARDGRYLV